MKSEREISYCERISFWIHCESSSGNHCCAVCHHSNDCHAHHPSTHQNDLPHTKQQVINCNSTQHHVLCHTISHHAVCNHWFMNMYTMWPTTHTPSHTLYIWLWYKVWDGVCVHTYTYICADQSSTRHNTHTRSCNTRTMLHKMYYMYSMCYMYSMYKGICWCTYKWMVLPWFPNLDQQATMPNTLMWTVSSDNLISADQQHATLCMCRQINMRQTVLQHTVMFATHSMPDEICPTLPLCQAYKLMITSVIGPHSLVKIWGSFQQLRQLGTLWEFHVAILPALSHSGHKWIRQVKHHRLEKGEM